MCCIERLTHSLGSGIMGRLANQTSPVAISQQRTKLLDHDAEAVCPTAQQINFRAGHLRTQKVSIQTAFSA